MVADAEAKVSARVKAAIAKASAEARAREEKEAAVQIAAIEEKARLKIETATAQAMHAGRLVGLKKTALALRPPPRCRRSHRSVVVCRFLRLYVYLRHACRPWRRR